MTSDILHPKREGKLIGLPEKAVPTAKNAGPAPMPERRMKRFEVRPEWFPMALVTGKCFEILQGLPDGAIFRGYAIDPVRNILVLFVEHESFDVVTPGSQTPPGIIEFGLLEKNG